MNARSHAGFTLIELLIVVAIIGIIAAIAVPGLLRARQSGNEASGIGSLNAINKAEYSYAATCASGAYAPTLTELGKNPIGGTAPFISADMNQAVPFVKSGYEINFGNDALAAGTPATCTGLAAGQASQGYHATATAQTGQGARDFGTNTTSTIWYAPAAGAAMAMTDMAAPAGAKVLGQ